MSSNTAVSQWGNTNNKRRVVLGAQCMKSFMFSDTMRCVAGFLGECDQADEERKVENVRLASWISGQSATWMSSSALEQQSRRLNKFDTVSAPSSADSSSEAGLSSEGCSSPPTPKMVPTSSPMKLLVPRENLTELTRAPRTRGPAPRFLC